MKYPACFYSKMFWVLLPIMIVTVSSGAVAIYAEFNERLTTVELTVAENNVPELKDYLIRKFSEANTRDKELSEKINTNGDLMKGNYRILCKLAKGDC